MQKARRHSINAAPTACRRTVSGSISPFYSKCFSPFLHSTCSLSVFQEYLALEDGPHIQTGFHVSRPTHLSSKYAFHIRGYHPLWPHFPVCSIKHIKTFGLIRFRSPLLTESLRFLFLRVLRCFSSPGLLLLRGDISSICRVAPFGHLRIDSCVPIPAAFAAYHVLLRL